VVVLGLTNLNYVVTNDMEMFQQLHAACEAEAQHWKEALESDVLGMTSMLRAIFKRIGVKGSFNFQNDGYQVDHIIRKIVLATVTGRELCIDWSLVTRQQLRSMVADENEYLTTFPLQATAADISLEVFHRADWGMLVSCYACLWHEVVMKPIRPIHEIMTAVASDQFARFLTTFVQSSRGVPTPFVAVREFFAQNEKVSPSAKRCFQPKRRRGEKGQRTICSHPKRRRGEESQRTIQPQRCGAASKSTGQRQPMKTRIIWKRPAAAKTMPALMVKAKS
jgi:hypothetical protein